MNGTYDVMLQGQRVGDVCLRRQGLYCHIRCSCAVTDRDIFRLLCSCGSDRIRLGVLIPEGNRLLLETKIPAKKLTEADLSFWLESVVIREQAASQIQNSEKYIPVYPDEPYAYIAKLKKSYLEIRNGKPGIVIKD